MSQVLGIPVSDFELSVRSRNCLQKMGINTLGDLARCSEQDLLASKNFGETSLVEIREMLASKGLRLGQLATRKSCAEPVFEPELDVARRAGHARPADLGPEPLGPCPQVHDPPGAQHHRRVGPPHRRRFAGVQEFRRHQPERSPRKADANTASNCAATEVRTVCIAAVVTGARAHADGVFAFELHADRSRLRRARAAARFARRTGRSRCRPSCPSARKARSRG